MPNFQLKDLLQALGPTASLIFAAWIFLTFLQSRYAAAYQYYRALIAELRDHDERDRRRESLIGQTLEYRQRCEQMRLATQIGVSSAIVLIASLVFGALGTMYDTVDVWKYLTAGCAIVGLLLVIWAAALVLVENFGLRRILDSDAQDVPELATHIHDSGSPHSSRSKTLPAR
jgi:Mn2+/Fe2+ NRAMP family transporter